MECKSQVIKITSPSFSKNEHLVKETLKYFPNTCFNANGHELKEEELIAFLSDADGAIVSLNKIDGALLDNCPNLKIISKYGVGLDNIDLDACRKRGVEVAWNPGTNKRSVAEETLCLMIGLCRNVIPSSYKLKSGKWDKSGGYQLSGKKVGIIGVGNVGKDLISLLKPFGCQILVNDIIDQSSYYRENNLTESSKEEIFRNADIITIHVPLNKETRYLINSNTLNMMRPTSYLINTSRGHIVNQEDLKKALIEKRIAGAALDVYEVEPPLERESDRELLALPNLVCTPHIGGSSLEGVVGMGMSAINGLVDYFSKK
ncbi:MAG: phosphoglycerate dehydrogenase [Nanoarchaeota archaeon]|nr:phosphoglycerate dehydrogenase [Nanoarchaeota archaeon]